MNNPKISELLRATTTDTGVVQIFGKSNVSFYMIGCSAPCSADSIYEPGGTRQTIDSCYVSLKRGDKAIIALSIKSKSLGELDVFLSMKWDEQDDKPTINLESSWVPQDPTRLGQIYYFGYANDLVVNCGDVVYTTAFKEPQTAPANFVHVPSAKIICQYLLGEVDELVLIHNSLTPKLEELASEKLSNALAKNDELAIEITNLRSIITNIATK